jgi:AraC-like DNA-binding protein
MGEPTYRALVNPASPLGGSDLARTNVILRAGRAGDYHVPSFTTPLSLKSAPRGVAHYATPRTRYRIDAGSIVIFNAGQSYTMDIDAADRTGTLCFFFEAGLVEGVAGALLAGERGLLEPDAGPAARPIEIAERVHEKTGAVAALLEAVERRLARGDANGAWLDEAILRLAAEIVILDGRARREAAALPGLRASTREEAYRRLYWARDYVDAAFAEPLTIATLARVACLSPFHFQRLFRAAFGETPMRRVQRLRLEAAGRLLVETDRPVTRVCADVGFESLGTFSALFKRRFGASPRAFREMRRIEEAAVRVAP